MDDARSPCRFATICIVAALVVGGACTSGLGLARSDDVSTTAASAGTTSASAPDGPAEDAQAQIGADVPAPAPDPASVQGADRFGIVASDDFCSAAPKVASAFVGLFDSVYARQGPELQVQVDAALVGIDVLRSVTPDQTRADLDTSREFLSRFRDVLAESGWSLETAAQRHADFFGGSEPDAGFAAMTAVMQAITAQCGFTP